MLRTLPALISMTVFILIVVGIYAAVDVMKNVLVL